MNFLYSDSVCEYSFNESYAALGAFRRYTGHGFVVFHAVEEVLDLGGVAVCARNVDTHIFAYLTGSGREVYLLAVLVKLTTLELYHTVFKYSKELCGKWELRVEPTARCGNGKAVVNEVGYDIIVVVLQLVIDAVNTFRLTEYGIRKINIVDRKIDGCATALLYVTHPVLPAPTGNGGNALHIKVNDLTKLA